MIGFFLGVIEALDELRHSRVFCSQQMHGGKHGDNVGLLETSTVGREQIEEILRSDAGVEAVGVAEATDPTVLDNV